jgi:hypothetical protein
MGHTLIRCDKIEWIKSQLKPERINRESMSLVVSNVLMVAAAFQPRYAHGFLASNDALAMFSSIMRLAPPPVLRDIKQYVDFHEHISRGERNGLLVQTIDDVSFIKINVFRVSYDDDAMNVMDCFWDKNTHDFVQSFVLLLTWHNNRFPNQNLSMRSNRTLEIDNWVDATLLYSNEW